MFKYKMIRTAIVLIVIFFYSGCGRDKIEAGSPEEVLSFIREKGNSSAVLDLYTDDTISLMKKYMKMTGMKSETSVDVLSFIPDGSDYKITGKKVDGKNCSLNIVFLKHGSENIIGQTVEVRMIKDGKNWKIDRKDDFKKLIESYEKNGAENYLNRIR